MGSRVGGLMGDHPLPSVRQYVCACPRNSLSHPSPLQRSTDFCGPGSPPCRFHILTGQALSRPVNPRFPAEGPNVRCLVVRFRLAAPMLAPARPVRCGACHLSGRSGLYQDPQLGCGQPQCAARRQAEAERLQQEISLLREEIRIKEARMKQIKPHRRSFYPPTARLAILELRAARGWSLAKTPGPSSCPPHRRLLDWKTRGGRTWCARSPA